MSLWSPHVDVITLFVEDVDRAKSFYHEVFELDAVYEDANSAVVKFDNLIVNLLDMTQAPELIAPGAFAPPASRIPAATSGSSHRTKGSGAPRLLRTWILIVAKYCGTSVCSPYHL